MLLNDVGLIIQKAWLQIPTHFEQVTLDVFTVMPNHLHAVIIIQSIVGATHASPLQKKALLKRRLVPGSLGAIVGSFKAAASKQINNLFSHPGKSIWQRNFFEHIIRNESSLERIREYICNNPLRWHLDQENPQRDGLDEFYAWIDKEGKNFRDIKRCQE